MQVFRTRSLQDYQDALAYACWFLINGRVGSRRDRLYLEDERNLHKFAKMSGSLRSYSFEEDINAEDENTFFA